MLTKRIIPCLDIKDGRVVKGVKFLGLKDAGDPVEVAKVYDRQLADELVFLDITASFEKRKTLIRLVEAIAINIYMPFTVGGGIRDSNDIRDLLNAGADKVSINTAVVKCPELIRDAAKKFGSQCIVVAIDAKSVSGVNPHTRTPAHPHTNKWEVYIHGGRTPTGIDAVCWAKKAAALGAGEILLTSMDYDGTKDGFDIRLTKAIVKAVNIPVIASGGAGSPKDFYEVLPIIDGKEWIWTNSPSTLRDKIDKGEVIAKLSKNKNIQIFFKRRLTDYAGQRPKTTWIDKKYNATQYGTKLLEEIIGTKLFSYPKSLYAVLDTLKIMTSNDDIIMDFFAGSGTTGHAVLELNKEDSGNRQFILIEQLDTHMNVILKRIKKVMEINNHKDKHFVYGELLKFNEEAMENIQDAKTTENMLKIWKEMVEHYFLNYDVDIKRFNDNQEEFRKLPLEKQKKLLVEMLNKNQLYVNLSEIDDAQFKVSKEDKEINKKFYK